MRKLRIAALALAAALVSLLVARVLTVDPPRPDGDAILDTQPEGPNNVPAPPPLPGAKAAHAVRNRPSRERIAATHPDITPAAPVETAETNAPEPRLAIRTSSDAPAVVEAPAMTAVAETASAAEPSGPVIVVPHERPKENSRGVRWIKAVGHALGIGAKDPAEESFK